MQVFIKNKYRLFNFLGFLLITAFSFSISFLSIEYSMWVMLFIIAVIFFFVYLKKNITDELEYAFLSKICIIAFSVRFVIIIMSTLFPALSVPSDALAYEAKGLEIANSWNNGDPAYQSYTQHFLYYVFNAAVYFLFGFFPSILRVINSFLGVIAGINVYFTTKELYSKSAAQISVFLILFFPSIIFWQTMNLKESFVVFLLTGIVRNLVHMKKNINTRDIFITFIYAAALTLTRSYLGILTGAVVCAYYLLVSKSSFKIKCLVVFAIALVGGVVTHKTGMGVFGINFIKHFNLSYIDAVRKLDYAGGSQVLENFNIDSISSLLSFLPIGLIYFLFSPFPWQINGSLFQFVAAVENTFWYALFCAFPIGAYISYKKNRAFCLAIFIIVIALSLFYAMSMGNIGLAYRMKAQLLPLFFIFISIGIDRVLSRFIASPQLGVDK